jgi:phosphonatase-like hydrolase
MGIAKPVAIRMLLAEQRGDGAVSEAEVDRIHTDFLARMLAYYREDPAVREVEGAAETFRILQEAGIKVALDTGFSRPIVDAILARLGWQEAGLIDATVASDEVAQGRPHPDLVYRAMELTGVTEAGRVAKVGDTPSDLLEGSAAGCGWVVGVTAGSHTAEELHPHPHTHLIPTIAALPSLLLP